jgi:hypothetical protein
MNRMLVVYGVILLAVATLSGQNAVLRVASTVDSCVDAGSTDSYACSLSPAITAYVTGARYRFKANTANTGAATIQLNGISGAKTIKKAVGGITTDLATNDIRAGQWVDLVYDGTNMQIQSQLGNASSISSYTDVVAFWTGTSGFMKGDGTYAALVSADIPDNAANTTGKATTAGTADTSLGTTDTGVVRGAAGLNTANAVSVVSTAGALTESGCTVAAGVMTCTGFKTTGAGAGRFTFTEDVDPAAPATPGDQTCWIDTDHALKCIDSASTVTTLMSTITAVTVAQVPASIDTRTVTFTDPAPVAGDDGLIVVLNPATAVHLKRIACGVTGTTSVVVNLEKGGASLIADLTATAGDVNTVVVTTWANGSAQCGGTTSCAVAAHTPVTVHIGAIIGTPTSLSCAIDFSVD